MLHCIRLLRSETLASERLAAGLVNKRFRSHKSRGSGRFVRFDKAFSKIKINNKRPSFSFAYSRRRGGGGFRVLSFLRCLRLRLRGRNTLKSAVDVRSIYVVSDEQNKTKYMTRVVLVLVSQSETVEVVQNPQSGEFGNGK